MELRNFEAFEAFINDLPQPQIHKIQRVPKIQFDPQCPDVELLKIVRSEQLPYVESIKIMHSIDNLIYLVSDKLIQVYMTSDQTQLIKRIELLNVTAISQFGDCLFVSQQGQVHLFELPSYALIGTYQFEIQYNFSHILLLDQSPKSLDFYEILLIDPVANALKLYANIYKIFTKRSIKYNMYSLLQRGTLKSGAQQWWVEKSQEFKVVYMDRVLLNSAFVLTSEQKFANTFVLLQSISKIEIFAIPVGQKDGISLIYKIPTMNGFATLGQDQFLTSSENEISLYNYSIKLNHLTIEFVAKRSIDHDINSIDYISDSIYRIQIGDSFLLMHTKDFQYQRQLYHNTKFKIRLMNKLLILTEDSFEEFQLMDFDKFLNDFVSDFQFEIAMKLSVRILNNEISILKNSDSPNEFCQKLAFTYCIFAASKLDLQSMIQIGLYLIKTNNSAYLFGSIRDLLQQCDKLTMFEEVIESLIQAQSINYIPDEYMYTLCQKYKSTNNLEMIRNLIYSLDLLLVETAIIVRICDELLLDDELIYICQVRSDFVTPITKLMGRENISERCYDYVILSLNGQNTIGDPINDNFYIQTLKNIVQFLFVTENMVKFIAKQDAYLILYQFFNGKAMSAICQTKAEIVLKTEISLEDFTDFDIEMQVHRKMFTVIKQCSNKLDFAIFCAKLILNNFTLSEHIKFECAKDLIRLLQPSDLQEQFIIKLLLKCNFSSDLLESLIRLFENMKQSIILAFLYSSMQRYGKAFEVFTNIECKEDYVFQWLQSLFQLQPNIAQSQNNDFIINAIKFLLQLNVDRAYSFIEKYLSKKQNIILDALEQQHQEHFVNYMTYLFSNESRIYLISDQIKIIYLRHQCKTNKSAVLSILQKVMFPLDEAMSIVEQYGILDAQAYIYTITGAMRKAMSIYSGLFLQYLKDAVKQLLKQQPIIASDYDELDLRLQNLIDMIKKAQKEDPSHSTLWFQFLELFFKDNKLRTFQDSRVPQSIKDLLCKYLSKILLTMSENLEVNYLFDQLQQNYGELPIQVFRDTINSIQHQSESDIIKYNQLSQVFANTQCLITDSLYKINQSAWVASFECSRCSQSMQDSITGIVFTCNHIFHDYCVLRGYAKIPYCDFCTDEITYKISHEKLFKAYQLEKQLNDQQLLQIMKQNEPQEEPPKKEVDRIKLLKDFDYYKVII